MNDILFGNNNKSIIKRITKRELSADKKRNFFIVAAILLTAFMLTSVFSIGMSYYDTLAMREKRMQGSLSQMAFARPTEEQLGKIYLNGPTQTEQLSAFRHLLEKCNVL